MSVRDRRAGPRAVVLEDAHGPGAAPRGQRVEAVARERDELARGGWREVGEALVVAPRRDEHFHRAARREAVARAARREAVARAARREAVARAGGAVERVEDGKRVLERARRPRAVGRHRGQVRVAELFVARAERAPRVDGGPGPRRAPIAAARRVRVVARLLRESRVRRHVEHDLVRRGVAAQFEAARRVAFALGRRQHGFELHALQ